MVQCRHPDIQRFGDIRCCLSCGEAVFEVSSRVEPDQERQQSRTNPPEYTYRLLKHNLGQEIRLLVLYPGEPSDDLVCDIIHVNLADEPAYEAVSYTWATVTGDAAPSQDIRCRGGTIRITRNCEAALRRLRLQTRNRRLWIDAICINQNDTTEKNHQVKLMSNIYTSASQVIAYLGVDESEMSLGLRNMVEVLTDDTKTSPNILLRKRHLNLLLELPYFDRVWVLQEIGLARLVTLVVGSYTISWTGATIAKILDMCSTLGIRPPSVLRWKPARRREEERDILAVLSRSRNCSATDPRDKVYALLGLAHSEFSDEFPVDYSLQAHDIFTKLATHLIDKGRFDVLKHTAKVQPRPSWVPMWDTKDVYEVLPPQFSSVEMNAFSTQWFHLSAASSAWENQMERMLLLENEILSNMSSSVMLSTLHWYKKVQNHCHGECLSTAEHETLTQELCCQRSQEFRYKICRMKRINDQIGPYLRIRAHRLDNIARRLTPIYAYSVIQLPRMNWPAFVGTELCATCSKAKVDVLTPGYQIDDMNSNARTAFRNMVALCGADKYAFSTERSVGFTRGDYRIRDSIWALYGADVPFILRQVEGHYVLVGECYLYRAGLPFPCKHCGGDATPWPMQTEIVDIW